MKRFLCLLITLCLLLSGCGIAAKPVQQTIFCMDTVMDIQLWGTDAEEAQAELTALLRGLEKEWSATDPDSVIFQLNNSPTFSADPRQAALLAEIEQLSLRSDGAFHPKMRCVSEAWGFCDEAHRIPTREEIAAALADPQWDLGGAIKGYAGQECAALLKTMDIDRAILNLGGNVQTYGEKSDGTPWQVGIQNPNFAEDYIGILSVTGTASIVTSGDYQRYFEIDGIRYHHILDPETGCPANSGLSSVTVICHSGLTADCLSTALFVMGLEAGSQFWRQSDDFEAVFITSEGKIFATEGAALSGCQFEVISR